MARPKAYDRDAVVRAARDLFWARGYEATSLADLERVTGLNRSSIYQEFESKHGLFLDAVAHYLREVAEPRLAALRASGSVPGYFADLAAALRGAPRWGCLVVNAITELAGRDSDVDELAAGYRSRITAAMTDAAPGRGPVLTGLVLGILVTARLDTEEAARLADAVATDELSRTPSPATDPGSATTTGTRASGTTPPAARSGSA